MTTFFSSEPKNFLSLVRAFSWFPADLQILTMCKLKFSSASSWTPRNFTDSFILFLNFFLWMIIFLFVSCNGLNLSWIYNHLQSLYRSPNQFKYEFESFSDKVELNLYSIAPRNPDLIVPPTKKNSDFY